MEVPEMDEEKTTGEIIETMQKISDITTKNYGRAVRSVHAKAHGLLYGELTVSDNLPPELAQGMFANVATYPIIMRLSTIPGDILDDSVSTPRGLAIKVIGVQGERLPGSENDVTQDFLLVNGPAFLKSTAKDFLGSLKLLAVTTDKAEGLKKAFSAVLRGTEKIIEYAGGESPTVISLGGHPETHILGETFYTQAPLLHGEYICKISVVPVSPALKALTHATLDVNGKPNGLREAVTSHFENHGGEWEVRAQLCNDIDSMPIEDASVVWSEEESPYLTVARISVQAQSSWDEARERTLDEGLSFSPWHGLAYHRPLGSIMRVRKAVYSQMAESRLKRNGCPLGEPVSVDVMRF
jgi:hypothetical protein